MSPLLASMVVSPWITLPIAGLGMVFVACHIEAVNRPGVPRSRRRIRTANGWVMLLSIPLLGAGSSVIDADTHPWAFSVVWIAASSLVALSVLLAMADIGNTLRLTRGARRNLRASLRGLSSELARTQRERGRDARRTADDQPTA